MNEAMLKDIPGYTYGSDTVPTSPISMHELDLLKQTVMFTEEDERYRHLTGEVLVDQVDQILDLWYGFIADYPHLLHYFSRPDGTPDLRYLEATRQRFGQWILDTCNRPYDQDWLNYQYEIALRHTPARKNKTDNVEAAPLINLRYLIAFIYPLTATVKPFLARKGHPPDEVERMFQAWFKAVTIQVALWTYPYAKDRHF